MAPVGQTIHLWRAEKGLTQEDVAERSGISRPNLSAIEQGARDLTVQTLRRIASALGTSPGALVDGIGPGPSLPPGKLDRYSLDRIARLAAGQALRASVFEKHIAEDLASVMKAKTRPALRGKPPNNVRYENTAILRLKVEIGPSVLTHLVRRVEKFLAGHHE